MPSESVPPFIDKQEDKTVKCLPIQGIAQKTNETYIPAQQYQAKTPSWFSRSHAHQSRASDFEVAQSQRQEALVRLTRKSVSPERRRFQRKHRLNNAADYNNVFKSSCRSRDSQFVVLACRNGKLYPRLGLAISRKAVKTAVSRNRIKRTIRESFRKHATILSGFDIVVLAQRQIKSDEGGHMSRSLNMHWQRILQCGQ